MITQLLPLGLWVCVWEGARALSVNTATASALFRGGWWEASVSQRSPWWRLWGVLSLNWLRGQSLSQSLVLLGGWWTISAAPVKSAACLCELLGVVCWHMSCWGYPALSSCSSGVRGNERLCGVLSLQPLVYPFCPAERGSNPQGRAGTSAVIQRMWFFSGKMTTKILIRRRRLRWKLKSKPLEREPLCRWRRGWSSSRTCFWREGSGKPCVCGGTEGGRLWQRCSIWAISVRGALCKQTSLSLPLLNGCIWYKTPYFKVLDSSKV